MGLPKTIRLDDELESEIENYINQNDIKFPQLVNLALRKFISERQTIELRPVDDKKWSESVERSFKTHKKAMDKLK
jgi:antitoxin component of RelBE/YafQ-DinJ toxin-antitoxin module